MQNFFFCAVFAAERQTRDSQGSIEPQLQMSMW